MDYVTQTAYNYNETTKQYTKCYPLTHMNAVYTKDDESETLGNKLADIDNAIDDNVNKIGVLNTSMENVNTQLSESAQQINNNLLINRLKTRFMMHRGASFIAPEETRPAFELASQLGIQVVEFDIWVTSDNQLIIQHDQTLDRMTNGTGDITTKTLNEILSYNVDGGNNISLYPNLKLLKFDEVVKICKKNNLNMMIDWKKYTLDESMYKSAIDIIKQYGMMDRCMFSTYYTTQALIVKRLAPELCVGVEQLSNETEWNNLLNNLDYALLDKTTITQDIINRLHLRNKKVLAYTVNTMQEVQTYGEIGVDFFMTDFLIDGGI